jgi:hypothetical protein
MRRAGRVFRRSPGVFGGAVSKIVSSPPIDDGAVGFSPRSLVVSRRSQPLVGRAATVFCRSIHITVGPRHLSRRPSDLSLSSCDSSLSSCDSSLSSCDSSLSSCDLLLSPPDLSLGSCDLSLGPRTPSLRPPGLVSRPSRFSSGAPCCASCSRRSSLAPPRSSPGSSGPSARLCRAHAGVWRSFVRSSTSTPSQPRCAACRRRLPTGAGRSRHCQSVSSA